MRVLITPTSEQEEVFEAFLASHTRNIVIRALAGSGKTTTIFRLVESNPSDEFIYLVYNVSTRTDWDKRAKTLNNVQGYTHNAYCLHVLRDMGYNINVDNNNHRMSVRHLNNTLGIRDTYLIGAAKKVVTAFLISADLQFERHHITAEVERDIQKKINQVQIQTQTQTVMVQQLLNRTFEIAHIIMDQFSLDDQLPLPHDVYVKLLQLRLDIPIESRIMLLDEAQDVNPVFFDIILRSGCRRIALGDPHQAIYGWRGARNYIERMLVEKDINGFLPYDIVFTQSFRFGEHIATKVNKLLHHMNTPLRIKGLAPNNNTTSSPTTRTIICQTNAGCIREALDQLERAQPFTLNMKKMEKLYTYIRDIYSIHTRRYANVKLSTLKDVQSIVQIKQEIEEDLHEPELVQVMEQIEILGNIEKAMKVIDRIMGYIHSRKRKTIGSIHPVLIQTAHDSKGLEYDHVWIGKDFKRTVDWFQTINHQLKPDNHRHGLCPSTEVKNTLYVACTRAKKILVECASNREPNTQSNIHQFFTRVTK